MSHTSFDAESFREYRVHEYARGSFGKKLLDDREETRTAYHSEDAENHGV